MLLMFDEVKTSAVIKYNNNNVATDPASVNIKIIGKFEELLKKHCVSFVQWCTQEIATRNPKGYTTINTEVHLLGKYDGEHWNTENK